VLDLAGLGTIDVLRARKAGTFDAPFVAKMTCAGAVTAVAVYTVWFSETMPECWVKVAEWIRATPPRPTDVLTFYAPRGPSVDALRSRLRAFAAALPEGVEVRNTL
jgi:hypothetical protein